MKNTHLQFAATEPAFQESRFVWEVGNFNSRVETQDLQGHEATEVGIGNSEFLERTQKHRDEINAKKATAEAEASSREGDQRSIEEIKKELAVRSSGNTLSPDDIPSESDVSDRPDKEENKLPWYKKAAQTWKKFFN